jgi:hypothetical protein
MKKKLIFAIAIGFFAVATVFNMNMLQSNDAGDISLEGIAVMAQAQDESSDPNPNHIVNQFEDMVWFHGSYWERGRYDALMKNRWYTDFYFNPYVAEDFKDAYDYFNISGDPVNDSVQNPDGSYSQVMTDRCDGQPAFC